MQLYTSAANIPHPDKVHRGGEDGFFLTTPSISSVGIADGVGGWANQNINPKLFADDLMEYTKQSIESGVREPVIALDEAYNMVEQTGSCTAVVGIMERDGLFSVANIGDSGFIVIRQHEILIKSKEQQHGFNFPYQLGKVEGKDGKFYEHGDDRPQDCETYQLKLHEGDIVVFGSDGLFDNIWDNALLEEINSMDSESPEKMANSLAEMAFNEAGRKDNWIPFTERALEQGAWGLKERNDPAFLGGKMDDITVVVAIVV
tara:strand:+ start:793 stop:1572 length:780 start_codon:yes stop_codon:yes gene_type:complete